MTHARRGRAKAADISEAQWAYLNDSTLPPGARRWDIYELDCNRKLGTTRPIAAELWAEFGPEVLDLWTAERPGTRPSCWWRFQAPRSADPKLTSTADGRYADPRRQVGGRGQDAYLAGGYAPYFKLGLPVTCMGYTARQRPRFESEAAYLARHGLLSDAERASLPPNSMKPIVWPLPVTED